jgi:hypothetical protein
MLVRLIVVSILLSIFLIVDPPFTPSVLPQAASDQKCRERMALLFHHLIKPTWFHFGGHWSSTYQICVVLTDSTPVPSSENIMLYDLLGGRTLATLRIDPNTRKVKECSLALDLLFLLSQPLSKTLSHGIDSGTHSTTSTLTCSSEEEFNSYVTPLMTN